MVEQTPFQTTVHVEADIPGCQGLKSTWVLPLSPLPFTNRENSSVKWESYQFTVSKGFICDTVFKVGTLSVLRKIHVIQLRVFRVQL